MQVEPERRNLSHRRMGPGPANLTPLLRTRFEPAAYAFTAVETRMLRSFRSGPLTKITVAVAPTGFGKTVLMTQLHGLFSGRGERCVWLGLDEQPVDLPALLTLLEAVLSLEAIETGGPMIVDARGDNAARIERIVYALGVGPTACLLFFDNLNACEDRDLPLLMDALVFRSACNVYVLASSTRPIDFDIGRALVEMKLRRLPPMELGFDRDDTHAVLRDAGLGEVAPETVATLMDRTESWPAAVRLMQLILTGGNGNPSVIEGFSGADRDFAALLSRRLIATFDPALVAFLYDIAGLRNFSAELAAAATGNPAAAVWIRYLVDRNVLIVPLDREQQWFRFHALFREFLLAETDGGERATRRQEVVVRAARWLGERGEYGIALDLALSAGDRPIVQALLEVVAQPMVRDRGKLLGFVDLVRRAASCGAEPGIDALFWYAWAQAFSRDYGGARATLRRLAEQIAREAPAETQTDSLMLRHRMAEIIVNYHLDDLRAVRDSAPGWLAAADDSHRAFDRAAVAAALALASVANNDFVAARQAIREVQGAIIRSRSAYGLAWSSIVAATVDLAQGDAAAAGRQLEAISGELRTRLGTKSGLLSVLALSEARTAADLGQTDAALDLVRTWMARGVDNGILEIIWQAMDVAVDALFTEKAPFGSDALRAFAARFGPRLTFLLEAAIIRRQLRTSAYDEGLEAGERVGLLSQEGIPVAALPVALTATELSAARMTQIEFCIAAGKWRQAEALLADAAPLSLSEGRRREQVEILLYQAALNLRTGHAQPSRMAFTRAVALATRQGLLRPFIQHRETVRGVIATMRKFGLNQPAELAFFDLICASVDAWPRDAEASLSHDAATPREIELLRLHLRCFEQLNSPRNSALTCASSTQRVFGRRLGVADKILV